MGRDTAFVEDQPKDLAAYGLEPPRHTVTIRVGEKEPITLKIGAVVPDTDPQQRYMLRVEDNAVYSARDGFLEAFMQEISCFSCLEAFYFSTVCVSFGSGELSLHSFNFFLVPRLCPVLVI